MSNQPSKDYDPHRPPVECSWCGMKESLINIDERTATVPHPSGGGSATLVIEDWKCLSCEQHFNRRYYR